MSEYPKTSEVTTIIEREIAPVAEESHTHDNEATLDSITPELFSDLSGLQQFEDSTQYDIQTLNEALDNLRQKTHTHQNADVLNTAKHTHGNAGTLDKITEEIITAMQDFQPFENWTREQIHTLFESVNNFSNTAHTHENKAVLDSITQEMLDDMASIATVIGQAHWHHNLTTLNGITESHVNRWNEA